MRETLETARPLVRSKEELPGTGVLSIENLLPAALVMHCEAGVKMIYPCDQSWDDGLR
ncbi:hypothetical protein BJX76DRAFT_320689 [Aspergillus varians]